MVGGGGAMVADQASVRWSNRRAVMMHPEQKNADNALNAPAAITEGACCRIPSNMRRGVGCFSSIPGRHNQTDRYRRLGWSAIRGCLGRTGDKPKSRNPSRVPTFDCLATDCAFKAADLTLLHNMLAAVINRAAFTLSVHTSHCQNMRSSRASF